MTEHVETFQLSVDAAEAYEARFVPALFGEWASVTVDAAGLAPGDDVLDVACGTGVVARAAADRLGTAATVTGVDLNDAMLTVARRLRPDIDWRHGDAAALPCPDRSFDAVLCQAALMFLPDPGRALREMARVARGGATIALQVWAGLADQPAYGHFVEVAARHAGPQAIELLSAYWSLGDLAELRALVDAAGLEVCDAVTRTGTARFDSVDELVQIEVESTPLIERIDNDVYGRIRAGAREVLAPFVTADGLAVPIVGHVLTARRQN